MSEIPRPILPPDFDKHLYCQRCRKEQLIRFLEPERRVIRIKEGSPLPSDPGGPDYYNNIECEVCNFLVARFAHVPPFGWAFDYKFSEERAEIANADREKK